MNALYEMIYKRRSVRKFDPALRITEAELSAINEKLSSLSPLCPDIKIAFRILPRENTTAKWGEYCLLVYSEKTDGYLENLGYMAEEMDLYFATLDIGACWYGLARTAKDDDVYEGLPYAIMIAFGKCTPEDFRTDVSQFDRKKLEDVWEGSLALDAAEAARLAPSACNSQPWRVVCENGNTLALYKKCGKLDILGRVLQSFYNVMDMGIYMKMLELSLDNFGHEWERELILDDPKKEMSLTARYTVK